MSSTDHEKESIRKVEQNLNNPELSDCLFYIGKEKKPICVIGGVLAMQSEYFKKLLYNQNFDKQRKTDDSDLDSTYDHIAKVFYEPDVSVIAFDYIVKYCHLLHDKLKIDKENVMGLLYASKKYLLNDIKDACTEFMVNNLNVDTILVFIREAQKYGLEDDDIKTKIIKLMESDSDGTNCLKLLQSKDFLQLPPDTISEFFVKNDAFVVKEEILFERCIEYCKLHFNNEDNDDDHDDDDEKTLVFDNWQSMMRKYFLFDIRFPLMDGVYFTEKLFGMQLLTYQEMTDISFQMINKNFYCAQNEEKHGKSKFKNTKRQPVYVPPAYIKYNLTMSSRFDGPANSYAALMNENTTQGAGTNSETNAWIEANFDKKMQVTSVELAGAQGMSGGWNAGYINDRVLQYWNDDGNRWDNILAIQDIKDNQIKTIDIPGKITTTKIRIHSGNQTYVATSRFAIKGVGA